MHAGMKKSVTAGSAILTASAVVLSPLPVLAQEPARTAQIVDLDLSAATNPLEAAAILAGGISDSAGRLAYSVIEIPAALLVGAYDLGVQNNRGLYFTVRRYVDAPVVIVDPIFEAFAQILPGPIGGTDGDPWNNTPADGAIVDFVDHVLWAGADAVSAQIAQALNVDPDTGYPLDPAQAGPPANLFQGAITLGVGVAGTAVRVVQGLAVSPLTAAQLAVGVVGALTTGNNKNLYLTIRNIVDGPLWAADPTIDALAKVLPRPLGGTDGRHEIPSSQDGQVINFRDRVLWGATNAIRSRIAAALNVDPQYGDPLPSIEATNTDTDPQPTTVIDQTSPSTETLTASTPSTTPLTNTDSEAATAPQPTTDVEEGTQSDEISATSASSATPLKSAREPSSVNDRLLPDTAGPRGTAGTDTKPGKAMATAVRNHVKDAVNKLNTAGKKLSERLNGGPKKPTTEKEPTQKAPANDAE